MYHTAADLFSQYERRSHRNISADNERYTYIYTMHVGRCELTGCNITKKVDAVIRI